MFTWREEDVEECAKQINYDRSEIYKKLQINIGYSNDYVFATLNWLKSNSLDEVFRSAQVVKRNKMFIVHNLNGDIIGSWINQSEFSKQFNVNKTYLNQCLLNNRYICKNYIILYKNDEYEENLQKTIELLKEEKLRNFRVYKLSTREFINEYTTIAECSKDLNLTYNGIQACLQKKMYHTKDYVFMYTDELNENTLNFKRQTCDDFYVFEKDTRLFVGEWSSQIECSNDLHLKKDYICACLNHHQKSTEGYEFYYNKDLPNSYTMNM